MKRNKHDQMRLDTIKEQDIEGSLMDQMEIGNDPELVEGRQSYQLLVGRQSDQVEKAAE